jgi:hypothetical protein
LAKYFKCPRTTIHNYIFRNNIKRDYSYIHIPEYQKYQSRVRNLSEKQYNQNIRRLNPHKYTRTLCGIPGGYQLDHIKGIKQCFLENVPVEIAAGLSNLQFIPWRDNLNRRNKRYVI